jgi:hypothetical protein
MQGSASLTIRVDAFKWGNVKRVLFEACAQLFEDMDYFLNQALIYYISHTRFQFTHPREEQGNKHTHMFAKPNKKMKTLQIR